MVDIGEFRSFSEDSICGDTNEICVPRANCVGSLLFWKQVYQTIEDRQQTLPRRVRNSLNGVRLNSVMARLASNYKTSDQRALEFAAARIAEREEVLTVNPVCERECIVEGACHTKGVDPDFDIRNAVENCGITNGIVEVVCELGELGE